MTKPSDHVQVSRRNLLKLGAGAVAAGSVTGWLGGTFLTPEASLTALASEPVVEKDGMTPDQAFQKLMDGNTRFVERKRQNPNQDFSRLKEVAQSQKPFAAILSCADSRVVPEIVFDQGIGDLFVVRVAGNVATIEDIASEEYGTYALGAKVLMVLGHERCGAVKAALEPEELPGMIGSLVYAIKPAVDATAGKPGDHWANAVKANVLMQVKRLQTSPVIFKLVQQGKLKVIGGYYDLDTGSVSLVS